MKNWIPYALAFLALLYLACPHIVECYEAYARPWNTEHMTNSDVAKKQPYHEGFEEAVDKPDESLSEILPGESKVSNYAEISLPEPTDVPPKEEKAGARAIDTSVQKPIVKGPPRKVAKPLQPTTTVPAPKKIKEHGHGKEIRGPKTSEIDPNEPVPGGDSGNGKHGSGIYPHIYGPDTVEAPGKKDTEDSSEPGMFDFVPAAEFPAGPLQPSPYLNDFSKILKT